MTARSAQGSGAEFFTNPEQVNQRRYEALRAFFVDGATHAEAGERFGYTRWAMVSLVRDYRAGKLDLFAAPRKPGPPPGTAPAKDRARGRVITLRREGLSCEIINHGDAITVRLNCRAYSPVLRQADLPTEVTVPWWDNRPLHYQFA